VEEIWGVRDERLVLLEDHVDGQDGVAAHVRVAVLEAGPDRRDQRLKDLRLLQLAQEAERATTNVFIRVLKVVPQCIANEKGQGKKRDIG